MNTPPKIYLGKIITYFQDLLKSLARIRLGCAYFLPHGWSCVTLYGMRYAILADIHSHTERLAKVLDHAQSQQIDRYFCLGDVGIDACVSLMRQAKAATVFGNWEVSGWPQLSPDNQSWVLALPPILKEKTFWLSHAAPAWPESITSLADFWQKRHTVSMTKLFPYLHFESEALWESIASLAAAGIPLMFHGHTHRQIVWRFTKENHLQKLSQRVIKLRPDDQLIVGVGSVGRPEDGPSPAYVVFDDEALQIELVRLP
jgi:predicted phosphodiesterase